MLIQAGLKTIQILLAASITITPLLYRKHSCYARKSRKAIQSMAKSDTPRDTINVDGEEIELWWIEKGETGFKQLVDAIKKEGIPSGETYLKNISGEISKIGVAHGSVKEVGKFADGEPYYGTTPNAVLYLEYTDGERETIIFRPSNINQTYRLASPRRWIDSRLTDRSQYLTSILAIWFTVVSIIIVL